MEIIKISFVFLLYIAFINASLFDRFKFTYNWIYKYNYKINLWPLRKKIITTSLTVTNETTKSDFSTTNQTTLPDNRYNLLTIYPNSITNITESSNLVVAQIEPFSQSSQINFTVQPAILKQKNFTNQIENTLTQLKIKKSNPINQRISTPKFQTNQNITFLNATSIINGSEVKIFNVRKNFTKINEILINSNLSDTINEEITIETLESTTINTIEIIRENNLSGKKKNRIISPTTITNMMMDIIQTDLIENNISITKFMPITTPTHSLIELSTTTLESENSTFRSTSNVKPSKNNIQIQLKETTQLSSNLSLSQIKTNASTISVNSIDLPSLQENQTEFILFSTKFSSDQTTPINFITTNGTTITSNSIKTSNDSISTDSILIDSISNNSTQLINAMTVTSATPTTVARPKMILKSSLSKPNTPIVVKYLNLKSLTSSKQIKNKEGGENDNLIYRNVHKTNFLRDKLDEAFVKFINTFYFNFSSKKAN